MVLLKVAVMSFWAGFKSPPKRLFAWACVYHVLGTDAAGKSRCTVFGPADPSVALFAVQDSGSNFAPTRITTGLLISSAQISAAYWKAIIRCCPMVVPVLPPTGVVAVGSLKPSPGPSRLTMVNVALALAVCAELRLAKITSTLANQLT